ncbi:MAG: ABC transporter substrate-binding protein [Deltaproteobacteria bacterium]|nr:ABC transporter substrate-binding protein [Deltaproteobacteria bacterium]
MSIMMRRISFLLALLIAPCLPGSLWSAEELQKIRIGFSTLAFSYMPFYVAQEKSLLKKQGLEAEYILMRSSILPQAVMNGNINFFPILSTGLSAAVSGLPVVVVLNLYNGTPWVLVTSKEINKPQDLIGKNVAIAGLRTSTHYFMLAGLKKLGLNEKDVGLVSSGGTQASFTALTSGQLAGAVVTPPFDDKAVSLGFKKFLFLGDLVDIPYTGLVTSQAEVKSNRDRVGKTITALLDGVSWLRANRGESVKMIADKFKVTQGQAEGTYETMISMFTKDGRLNPKVARGYMDVLRQDRPVPPDLDPQKFLDFSMLPASR